MAYGTGLDQRRCRSSRRVGGALAANTTIRWMGFDCLVDCDLSGESSRCLAWLARNEIPTMGLVGSFTSANHFDLVGGAGLLAKEKNWTSIRIDSPASHGSRKEDSYNCCKR